MPADDPSWDPAHTYVGGLPSALLGRAVCFADVYARRAEGLAGEYGLEVVYDHVGIFQPAHEECDPEHQQYVVARRRGEADVSEPRPLP